jgi:SAM-dependent methyltransferase
MNSTDPKRVVAEGYDRMGLEFSAWNSQRPPGVRRWYLDRTLERVGPGSSVLELGCGPGTDAGELSEGRRYVGVDLSWAQLSMARRRVPDATFVLGDVTSIAFRPGAFDSVVAFYFFMHIPHGEFVPTLERIFSWLRPGGWLMLSLPTTEAPDRVEEWLDVPMFFGGTSPPRSERLLREAGFHLELSEIREEMQARYGPTDFHWVIARKPEG